MKVVTINSVSGFGSTGKIVNEVSRALDQIGIENYAFYGRKDSDFKNAIKFGGHLNVLSHLAKTRILGKHGFYSKNATRALVKKLKEIKPDIIHLHNLHGYYLNVEILFKYLKTADIKVVWTLHDCWSFTGQCAHYDFVDCQKWQTHCHHCPQTKVYYKTWFFDRTKEAYTDKKALFNNVKNMTLISPSKWLAKEVGKSFLSVYPIKVINNGIDLEQFKPIYGKFRKNHQIEDKFIILGVASDWSERKGLNYFIDLSKNLVSDEVLVLVGLSGGQVKSLPDNIIKISRTNSIKELAEIYTTANVYINLTLEDTFPTTNIEALACGTPVITFDVGGSPEIINNETGIVVSRKNLKDVRVALDTIKSKPFDFYKEACISLARGNYNKDEAFVKYIDLYKSLSNK